LETVQQDAVSLLRSVFTRSAVLVRCKGWKNAHLRSVLNHLFDKVVVDRAELVGIPIYKRGVAKKVNGSRYAH